MAGKVEELRKRQIAMALAEKTGGKLKTALAVVDFIFDEIAVTMAKGVKVNIKDFGIFVKAMRKARIGRNPATGEQIKIKASVKPRFTASKTLKEAMAGKKYPSHADLGAICCCTSAAPKKAAAPKKVVAKKPAKKGAKKR